MLTISEEDFKQDFDKYFDLAGFEPVKITGNNRDSVVLISAIEYERYQALSGISKNEG